MSHLGHNLGSDNKLSRFSLYKLLQRVPIPMRLLCLNKLSYPLLKLIEYPFLFNRETKLLEREGM